MLFKDLRTSRWVIWFGVIAIGAFALSWQLGVLGELTLGLFGIMGALAIFPIVALPTIAFFNPTYRRRALLRLFNYALSIFLGAIILGWQMGSLSDLLHVAATTFAALAMPVAIIPPGYVGPYFVERWLEKYVIARSL